MGGTGLPTRLVFAATAAIIWYAAVRRGHWWRRDGHPWLGGVLAGAMLAFGTALAFLAATSLIQLPDGRGHTRPLGSERRLRVVVDCAASRRLALHSANNPAPLDPEIAYWLEMSEAIAIRDTYEAAIEGMPGNPLGFAVRDVGGGVAMVLGAQENPFFNRVVGLGVKRPATPADVDAAIAFFDEHDRTFVAITVSPFAQPPELADWLTERGFPVSRSWPKLWRSLADLPDAPPTTLRIESIGRDRAEDFATVVNTAFEFGDEMQAALPVVVGRPGWTHYLGFDGDEPVAAGAMYVTGDIAWLGFGATLEAARGRGGQSAIFHRRLSDAKAAGCRLAFTETGPDSEEEPNHSFRNMIRLGFRVAYHRPNFVRRPPEG